MLLRLQTNDLYLNACNYANNGPGYSCYKCVYYTTEESCTLSNDIGSIRNRTQNTIKNALNKYNAILKKIGQQCEKCILLGGKDNIYLSCPFRTNNIKEEKQNEDNCNA